MPDKNCVVNPTEPFSKLQASNFVLDTALTISEIPPDNFGCVDFNSYETYDDPSWFFEMVSEDQSILDYCIYRKYRLVYKRLRGGISLSDAPYRLIYSFASVDCSLDWFSSIDRTRYVLVEYPPFRIAGFRNKEDLILFKLSNDFWKTFKSIEHIL
jgi:hypothetical protein